MAKKDDKDEKKDGAEKAAQAEPRDDSTKGIERPAHTTTQNVGAPVPEANPTHFDKPPKSGVQQAAELASHEGQKYYDRYPKIRGGICEFCGIHYSKCPHYADYHKRMGDFICACGRSKDPMAVKQLQLMYVPHRGYFLCDSAGCAGIYKDRFGGYERLVSYHFFVSEVPYEGNLLPDPSDPQNRATSLTR